MKQKALSSSLAGGVVEFYVRSDSDDLYKKGHLKSAVL